MEFSNNSALLLAGQDRNDINSLFDTIIVDDVDWRNGRLQGLNHYGGEEAYAIALEAYERFAASNPVSGRAFPSIAKLQNELLTSAVALMSGDENTCGIVTSGGTESIFLAMLAARNQFKNEHPDASPNIVIPSTAHPAFNKHAHYLGIKVIRIEVSSDFRADVNAMEEALSSSTMMIVGSAPCYPYGLFDPITNLAELATRHGVWMHVDACIGGFQSPFVKALGYNIPEFGFDVPGVMSLSADLHKYGFALKGASVVLFRNAELRSEAEFKFTEWPRGLYATQTFSGTRSGGPVAAAWAVMRHLGFDGYVSLNKRIMGLREELLNGLDGLDYEIVGEPELSLIAIRFKDADLQTLSNEMAKRGWLLNLLLEPVAVQVMLNISHEGHIETFISDIKASLLVSKKHSNTLLTAEY